MLKTMLNGAKGVSLWACLEAKLCIFDSLIFRARPSLVISTCFFFFFFFFFLCLCVCVCVCVCLCVCVCVWVSFNVKLMYPFFKKMDSS